MTSLPQKRFTMAKAKLHGGCAAITCALMLGLAVPASAQISGTLISDSGDVTVGPDVGPVSNVQVRSPETLISWQPTGSVVEGATTFLPSGNSLNFEGVGESGRYVVLNKFVNSEGADFGSAVAIMGNVTSDANVDLWFQNGGGLLIGASATFDVGSLLLTTQDTQLGGVFEYNGEGSGGQTDSYIVHIRPSEGVSSNAAVDVRGRITVGSGGPSSSYFAVVAPRIAMSGTADVAGSVAYVAAEAANITISDNLFDIRVSEGTSVAEALTHSGSTIVATSAANQNIYMVAIPKNNAVSMLVQGNLGFDAATASVTSDGSIILSAGRNIVGGGIDYEGDPSGDADIRIGTAGGNSNFNGTVTASASRDLSVNVASGTTLNVSNSLFAEAGGDMNLTIAGSAANGISVGSVFDANAGGDINLTIAGSAANGIRVGSDFTAHAGGKIDLRHTGRSASSNSVQAGLVDWFAGTNIIANADSKISIVSDGRYNGEHWNGLTGNEGIDLGHISSDRQIEFNSEGGSLLVDNFTGGGRIFTYTQAVDIASTEDLYLGPINAYDGDLRITTTGDIYLSGSMSAGNDIILSSSSLSGLGGEGSLADFEYGGRARLINIDPSRPMIIGGYDEYYPDEDGPNEDVGPRYIISNSQLGDSYDGANISFESPASTANGPNSAGATPQIIIRDADFFLGDTGSVSFVSGGDIRVEGNLFLLAEGNGVNLNLNAARSMHLVAGEGSIYVGNEGSGMRGAVNISAPRVMLATQAAYDDLISATSIRQYEQRLAQNDGIGSQGVLSARTINVQTDGGFFVQNVGDSAEVDTRRGVIFGDGGLNITSTNASPMVVINGAQEIFDENEGGFTMFTGAAALAGITINGDPAASANGFNRQSLMNGCLLVNSATCGDDALQPETPSLPEFPIQVVIKDPINDDDDQEEEALTEERESSEMPESLITASNLTPLTGQPLTIDPVTGAANDDMWGPSVP
jgi:filamentous hemagglutinin family protein